MGSERRTFRGLKSGQKVYKARLGSDRKTATLERIDVKHVDVFETSWGNEYVISLNDGDIFSAYPLNSFTYAGRTLYGANLRIVEHELNQAGWNIVRKF